VRLIKCIIASLGVIERTEKRGGERIREVRKRGEANGFGQCGGAKTKGDTRKWGKKGLLKVT